MKKTIIALLIPLFSISVLTSWGSLATRVKICAVKGTVTIQAAKGFNGVCSLKQTLDVTECRVVNGETRVETGPNSFAVVEYMNHTKVKIVPNTTAVFSQNNIYIQDGETWFKVEHQDNGKLVIKTPTAIAGIRGTEFVVQVKEDGTSTVKLIEGKIEVSDINQQSSMNLNAGMEVEVAPGSSTLNTKLLEINDKWWTDWPTLVPISEKPGYVAPPSADIKNKGGIPAVADAYVYAYNYRNWNRSNRGKYEQLVAGWNPIGGESRAYLKFDISSLDPSQVKKATLRLFHFSTSGNSNLQLGLYRVSDPWLEGTDTYHSGQNEKTAAPGELSWEQQPVFNNSMIAEINPGAAQNHWIDVDITQLVKNWMAGFKNNGLVIKPKGNLSSSVSESLYHFASREFENGSKSPVLIINGTDLIPQTNASAPQIVGDWNWFTNVVVSINADGTVKGSNGGLGKWKINNSGDRFKYRIDWTNGYTDKLNLSGNTLKGENQNGTTVWGKRIISSTSQGNSEIPKIAAGTWTLNQDNGYTGNMTLQQNQSAGITGSVIWNGYLKGTIEGKIIGDKIELTVDYHNGDIGYYKGTLVQNGTQIINGTVEGNNGVSAQWIGHR